MPEKGIIPVNEQWRTMWKRLQARHGAGIPSPLRRGIGPAPEQVWAWSFRLQTQPKHTERISVSAVDYVTSVSLFIHHPGTGTPVKGGNSLPNIANKTLPINTYKGIFAKKPSCPEREGERMPLRPDSGNEGKVESGLRPVPGRSEPIQAVFGRASVPISNIPSPFIVPFFLLQYRESCPDVPEGRAWKMEEGKENGGNRIDRSHTPHSVCPQPPIRDKRLPRPL